MLATELIRKRKDRAIAIVLGIKEREVDPLLGKDEKSQRAKRMMRKVILDQFNDLADLACDVASSGEASHTYFNDELWEARLKATVQQFEELYRSLMQDEEEEDLDADHSP